MTRCNRKRSYTVIFSKKFPKELAIVEKSGDRHIRDRVKSLVNELEKDPFTKRPKVDIRPLSGIKKNMYRVRLGNYRLVYEIFEAERTVILTAISKREKAYRGIREPGKEGYSSNSESCASEGIESDEEFYGKLLEEHRKAVELMKAGEFVRLEDFDKALDELEEEEQSE